MDLIRIILRPRLRRIDLPEHAQPVVEVEGAGKGQKALILHRLHILLCQARSMQQSHVGGVDKVPGNDGLQGLVVIDRVIKELLHPAAGAAVLLCMDDWADNKIR